ncbi:class I SAM-dependent methyltransferase [Clostridium cochlearium]|uniref:Class I SAM-dependent methyltransferase n=1 Tax=Clostridium cochlearium TaxID=1494 RepID=A0A7Y3V6K0_CLOCO|nr:class I SAM-dependent methyltransferase [Clostridium cochlearium]NOH15618.1 class I SAM-dependent methyltransferase [Clostridium cochlearium]
MGICLKKKFKSIEINIDKGIFNGELLDIGFNNNGILYNGYKYFNKEVDIDYINGREEKDLIEKNFYDNCTLMFVLNNIQFKSSKEKLFKEIKEYIKKDGYIYIWDIDKGFKKCFNNKIVINLPNNIQKDLYVKNFNILRDNSQETTIKIIEKYYDVQDIKNEFGIYFIKAKNSK